jgi:hypothetical protein
MCALLAVESRSVMGSVAEPVHFFPAPAPAPAPSCQLIPAPAPARTIFPI